MPENPEDKVKIKIHNLYLYINKNPILKNITLSINRNEITAIIGPSGSGKTCFLRVLNRLHDLYPNISIEGKILIDNEDIYSPFADVVSLRRKVGMVFQKPNPFPISIFDNVAYGLRIHGIKNNKELKERVEASLREAALWEEVKERLYKSALILSGGQQQRLCIARMLAIKPEIILMDEPASALDPISTAKIEELLYKLKQNYTIVIVTHNMQQAARIADYTGFFFQHELIEFDKTELIFTAPKKKLTETYITGRLVT
jgi:phosphate transport system ATP-binding protein